MKRSEAIKCIVEELLPTLDINKETSYDYQEAEKILLFISNTLGMIPPLAEIEIEFEGLKLHTDAFEWENE